MSLESIFRKEGQELRIITIKETFNRCDLPLPQVPQDTFFHGRDNDNFVVLSKFLPIEKNNEFYRVLNYSKRRFKIE